MVDLEIPPQSIDSFYSSVWKIVQQIPSGKVTTYGQIAALIPCPEGVLPDDYKVYRARWVGNAMAASPQGIPWQRVINSQGKISLRLAGDQQRKLLEAEGIAFDAHEQVDLKRFGWKGPSADWLRANDLIPPDEPQQLSFLT